MLDDFKIYYRPEKEEKLNNKQKENMAMKAYCIILLYYFWIWQLDLFFLFILVYFSMTTI